SEPNGLGLTLNEPFGPPPQQRLKKSLWIHLPSPRRLPPLSHGGPFRRRSRRLGSAGSPNSERSSAVSAGAPVVFSILFTHQDEVMISQEQMASIRRLFFVEHWKVGTIASELGLHSDTVKRALQTDRFKPHSFPPRPYD